MTCFIGDRVGDWRLWGVWFGKWFVGISKDARPQEPTA